MGALDALTEEERKRLREVVYERWVGKKGTKGKCQKAGDLALWQVIVTNFPSGVFEQHLIRFVEQAEPEFSYSGPDWERDSSGSFFHTGIVSKKAAMGTSRDAIRKRLARLGTALYVRVEKQDGKNFILPLQHAAPEPVSVEVLLKPMPPTPTDDELTKTRSSSSGHESIPPTDDELTKTRGLTDDELTTAPGEQMDRRHDLKEEDVSISSSSIPRSDAQAETDSSQQSSSPRDRQDSSRQDSAQDLEKQWKDWLCQEIHKERPTVELLQAMREKGWNPEAAQQFLTTLSQDIHQERRLREDVENARATLHKLQEAGKNGAAEIAQDLLSRVEQCLQEYLESRSG